MLARSLIIWMIFCSLFTIHSKLHAQVPYFKNIVFDKEKKGAKLLKIYQDKNGYMWLGTNFGICRYDGINFNYLEMDDNQESAITENSNGALWIGHMNGVIEYVENNIVKGFLDDGRLAKIKITDMLFDKQNRLWFSTYGKGIYCYDKSILHNINRDDGLTDNNVNHLLLNGDKVWAATDMGISICSFKNGRKEISVINQQNGLPDNMVRNMKQDAAGNIWIALQQKGVCFFDKDSRKIKVPAEMTNWKYGQVNDVLPMKTEIFIGTEKQGVIEMHSGQPVLWKPIGANKKKITTIRQLLMDKNGQVWVVADNMLYMANSNLFQMIEIPAEWQDGIKALTTDYTGNIWFANKKGLFVKKINKAVQKIKLPGRVDYYAVTCLYADNKKNIWIGTYNNGLYRYIAGANKLVQYTKANGPADNNIFSITGMGNEIWLATMGGATKMDIASGTPGFHNYTKPSGLSNKTVNNIFIDHKGNKWLATDGGGISKFGENGFHNYTDIKGLDKNIVYNITEDRYGNIWFTGRNSGLFVLTGSSVKRYGIEDGLQDNEILNMGADGNGNLLLTHPDGLEIFDIKKEYFTFYGAESGIENINPQINAFCRTRKNELLVGATDKIIQYHAPDTSYQQFPETVLNSVSVFSKPVIFSEKNNFSYDENHLTFDYAGLWFINPEAVNYQYQLEGYSKDWINTRDHIITFPNLAPGRYTFKVKAAYNNDFRYASALTYSFFINDPFWKTEWFFLLASLLFLPADFLFCNHQDKAYPV